MYITEGPRGILQIDGARLTYKNFSGEATPFNRAGDRNFSVIIEDQDVADRLIEEGWNVKIKPARDEDDVPFMHLPVKIKFNGRGPTVRLVSGDSVNLLNEETIGCLDDVYMLNVDLDIRPYDWEVQGKSGRTAYLHAIEVTQEVDRFEARRANEE
jgi:hypothetical protein